MIEQFVHYIIDINLAPIIHLLLFAAPTAWAFLGGYLARRLSLALPYPLNHGAHTMCHVVASILGTAYIRETYVNDLTVWALAVGMYLFGLASPRRLDTLVEAGIIAARARRDRKAESDHRAASARRDASAEAPASAARARLDHSPIVTIRRAILVGWVAALYAIQFALNFSVWDRVIVALKWKHQAQFAGFYAAAAEGFYRRNNIIVTFVEGGFDERNYPIDIIRDELFLSVDPLEIDGSRGRREGQADSDELPRPLPLSADAVFGVTGPLDVIRAQGDSAEGIQAVAVIFRRSPACWFSASRNVLKAKEELSGATVAVSATHLNSVDWELEVWLREAGLADVEVRRTLDNLRRAKDVGKESLFKDFINEIELPQANLNSLAALGSEIDVWTGYWFNEYLRAREIWGKDVSVATNEEANGNVFYGDVLATRTSTIMQKPDLVRRFVAATLDGWQVALAPQNEERVVNMIAHWALGIDRNHELAMLKEMRTFVSGSSQLPLGEMDDAAWQDMIARGADSEVCRGDLEAPKMYTNRFVDDWATSRGLGRPN